ncbi:MAG: hypothetical protein DHS20C13_18810 [Thermodesulfobacteriota bacterium]|nr:MAG: hypothetical protein DHS20C13_18810 [Thermodesulfobacteriota bacterium]
MASTREHTAEMVMVHPSIGNLFVWRSIYKDDDRYYVQAIRVSPFSEPKIYSGDSIKVFIPEVELDTLDLDSVFYSDIRRFRKFARDYLVVHPDYPGTIGDLRMGILPNSIKPLWGISINLNNQNEHVSMDNYERSVDGNKIQIFISMLLGRNLP